MGAKGKRPKVLFCAAAGGSYGMGHLSRCLSIMDAGRGTFDAALAVVKGDGGAPGSPAQTYFQRARLEGGGGRLPAFLDRPGRSERFDLVVVDMRDSSKREMRALARAGPVLSIDDLGEGTRYAAFTLHSLTAGAPRQPAPDDANFRGPPYIVLGRDAAGKRPKGWGEKRGVLVTFGGSDPHDLTGLVAPLLEGIFRTGRAGPGAAGLPGVRSEPSSPSGPLTVVKGPLFTHGIGIFRGNIVDSPPDLAELINASRAVITSFGLTMYEAFALGTPVVLFNHTAYHSSLARELPVVNIGYRGSVSAEGLRGALRSALGDEQTLRKNAEAARRLVDGRGAQRVAGIIGRMLMGARKDCLFGHGVNDALVRDGERTVLRCRKCGDLFLYESGGRKPLYDSEEYFNGEYKRAYGKTYIEDRDAIDRLGARRIGMIERLLGMKGRPPERGEARLLDVGCALGFFLDSARRRGWEAQGVEVSRYASEWGRKNLSLDIATGSFLDAHIAPGSFDAVTLFFVAEHFADIEEVASKASRALKKGGVLALALPNRAGISFRLDRNGYLARRPVDHFFDASPKTVTRFLKNFHIIKKKIVATGIHPERFFERAGVKSPPPFLEGLYGFFAKTLRLGDTFEFYGIKE